MAPEPDKLARLVDAWSDAVDDVLTLLRSLTPEQWATPTDLPGWDVRAVAAHLAHIEAELAGMVDPVSDVAVSTPGPAMTVVAAYTESGVRARSDATAGEILAELEKAAARRLEDLRGNPPADPAGTPSRTPGGVAWDWATLLGNRVIDVWMHDQDIRRAVGRPGATGTAAARHTLQTFTRGFLYVVGKRVAPSDGTTVVLDVTGETPVHLPVTMQNGRAVPMSTDPAEPDSRLRMDQEAFMILAGGRRAPDRVDVEVAGDEELARRTLDAMAITP